MVAQLAAHWSDHRRRRAVDLGCGGDEMAGLIDKPGIYRITAAEYHADPCVVPNLSSMMRAS